MPDNTNGLKKRNQLPVFYCLFVQVEISKQAIVVWEEGLTSGPTHTHLASLGWHPHTLCIDRQAADINTAADSEFNTEWFAMIPRWVIVCVEIMQIKEKEVK